MMRREWVARCDRTGCTAIITTTESVKAYAGQDFNDAGWWAAPSSPNTYCPDHWPTNASEMP